MDINAGAATARETFRRPDGRFGEQGRTDPGQLALGGAGASPASFTFDGATFHRSDLGAYCVDPYHVAVRADRPISDAEMRRMAQGLGYVWRSKVRGEPVGEPVRVDAQTFMVHADSTKSRRDDLGVALEEFEEHLPSTIRDGSPIRTTDRAGAGTKGTRLVDGVGPVGFDLYYDGAADPHPASPAGPAVEAARVEAARSEYRAAAAAARQAQSRQTRAGIGVLSAGLGPHADTVVARYRDGRLDALAVLDRSGSGVDGDRIGWVADTMRQMDVDPHLLAREGLAARDRDGTWRIRLP